MSATKCINMWGKYYKANSLFEKRREASQVYLKPIWYSVRYRITLLLYSLCWVQSTDSYGPQFVWQTPPSIEHVMGFALFKLHCLVGYTQIFFSHHLFQPLVHGFSLKENALCQNWISKCFLSTTWCTTQSILQFVIFGYKGDLYGFLTFRNRFLASALFKLNISIKIQDIQQINMHLNALNDVAVRRFIKCHINIVVLDCSTFPS